MIYTEKRGGKGWLVEDLFSFIPTRKEFLYFKCVNGSLLKFIF
jgi:hypothetical protein